MSASAELRRLRYLAAMGVPVYVSHRTLPGAAATAKLALRRSPPAAAIEKAGVASLQTSAAFETSTATFKTTPPQRTPAAAQALRDSLRRDAKQDTSSKRTATVGSTADASGAGQSAARPDPESARFRIAAIVFAQRLWVEELGDEALASEQLQLILAIGRALAHPGNLDAQPGVTEFRWPLHDNTQLGLGADEASASLQGFLQRQLDDHGCVEMICLGDPAKRLLGDLSVPCARRFIPSTRRVLESPLLKRDVWAALSN